MIASVEHMTGKYIYRRKEILSPFIFKPYYGISHMVEKLSIYEMVIGGTCDPPKRANQLSAKIGNGDFM